MSLTDHFTIGQRVRVLTEPDPDIAEGVIDVLDPPTFTLCVKFTTDDEGGSITRWYDAHEVLDATYADLNAWMGDSGYTWNDDGKDLLFGPGWYEYHHDRPPTGPYDPARQYAAAIGAA